LIGLFRSRAALEAAQAVQDRKREHAVYQDEDAASEARTLRSKPKPKWVTLVRADLARTDTLICIVGAVALWILANSKCD